MTERISIRVPYRTRFLRTTTPDPEEPPGELDPADVIYLLHMNGADGGTTFTDAALVPFTWGADGAAVTSTSEKKFGTASAHFPTGGVIITSNADQVGKPHMGGVLTMEGWVRPAEFGSIMQPFGMRTSTGPNGSSPGPWTLGCYILEDGTFAVWRKKWGGTGVGMISQPYITADAPLTVDVWSHIAVTRDAASILRLFVHGVLQSTTEEDNTVFQTETGSFFPHAASYVIGLECDTGYRNFFLGYIDEARAAADCAYTTTFTPQIIEHPNP